ncbi:MAG: filamentous hemagglutinin N-terminal domain-containing protein [Methylococcales bacterium]|nr:filamentous hemagglutinin N-terminal domain-containing protein [Methylococcales bacterium]
MNNNKPKLMHIISEYCRPSIAIGAAIVPSVGLCAPSGGAVVSGGIDIQQDGLTTNIFQSTQSAIINWDSFNIGANETVNFIQPSSTSVALNRVISSNPTTILGNLNANGVVILVNPRGILFTKSATLDVAGLVATTLDIGDQDFLNGQMQFTRQGDFSGQVVNEGQIHTEDGGYVVLAGDYVENTGIVTANLGAVGLAAGQNLTLDLQGDGLVSFVVSGDAVGELAGVKNTGDLLATGGRVVMTADVAASLISTSVSNSGLVRAQSITEHQGEIFLSGNDGDVINTGVLDVSSVDGTVNGGNIDVLGDQIALLDSATLDASGLSGGNIHIGGDFQGKGSRQTSQKTIVSDNVVIRADAVATGDGGQVIIWSDDFTHFSGDISAVGGSVSGDGGFVEVSGKQDLNFTGFVDVSTVNGSIGTLLLDPATIDVSSNTGTVDSTLIGQGGIINFADFAGQSGTLGANTISSLLTVGNVILQADISITFDITSGIFQSSAVGALIIQSQNVDIQLSTPSSMSIFNGATKIPIEVTASTFSFPGATEGTDFFLFPIPDDVVPPPLDPNDIPPPDEIFQPLPGDTSYTGGGEFDPSLPPPDGGGTAGEPLLDPSGDPISPDGGFAGAPIGPDGQPLEPSIDADGNLVGPAGEPILDANGEPVKAEVDADGNLVGPEGGSGDGLLLDEKGEPIVDENGEPIREKLVDENGEPIEGEPEQLVGENGDPIEGDPEQLAKEEDQLPLDQQPLIDVDGSGGKLACTPS